MDRRLSSIGVTTCVVAALVQFEAAFPRTVRGDDRSGPNGLSAELAAAIRSGDEAAVRRLIENGTAVNARDAEGNTALIVAALYARPECLDLLLKKGADANAANRAGTTALIRAATSYDKARLLLDAGAKAHAQTALGNTSLMLAARRYGNSRTVKLLLERGADVGERNKFGVGPMLAGAASGDLETVRLLLDRGADPNDFPELRHRDAPLASGSRTPLMWAAYHNDVPMVRLLLDRGADPNKMIVFGSPLSHACWHDSLEAAELLIERGAKVDSRDPIANFTPLHWAASSESPRADLVKLLLAKGADPNAEGGQHVGAFVAIPQTPRLLAEKRGRTAIVAALIAAGAKEPPQTEKFPVPKRPLADRLRISLLTDSTEKVLAALQTTAARSRDSFLRHASHQDCTTCHQQYLPMAAVGQARGRAVGFDLSAAREQLKLIDNVNHLFFEHEYLAQTVFHPDPAYTIGYETFGLLAEKVPASVATDVQVHHLLAIQAADGRWFGNLPRPPIQSGDVAATALAIQAINRYGWPAGREEVAASIERGRNWLRSAPTETNEEAVFQLLGLSWAGEPAEKLADLAGSLVKRQQEDGGWAQLPALGSDAYATGQVLFALAQTAKDSLANPAWERGLRFLLERQEDDGTWHVARRAFPFQPTMDSGFPHHRDSWVSTAATAWAAMALAQTLPAGTAIDKPGIARGGPVAVAQAPQNAQRVDFALQVKPLLERSCVACHTGERPRASFRLDGRENLLKGGDSGTAAIVPGESGKSLLIEYVSGSAPELEMPPRAVRGKFPALTKDDVTLLRHWIDQGAEWPKDVKLAMPEPQPRR